LWGMRLGSVAMMVGREEDCAIEQSSSNKVFKSSNEAMDSLLSYGLFYNLFNSRHHYLDHFANPDNSSFN
jgi:hypothetical protein